MSKADTSIGFYRDKVKMSQQQLADSINVHRTTMSFIERKREYPNIETAEKIAELLDVPIGKLYTQDELEVMKTK